MSYHYIIKYTARQPGNVITLHCMHEVCMLFCRI